MYRFQLHNHHTSFLKYDFSGLLRSEHHRTKKHYKNMKALRFKLRWEYKCQRIDTYYRHADSDSSVSSWRDCNSDSEDSLAPSNSDFSSTNFYPPKCFKSNKKKEEKSDAEKTQKKQKKGDSKSYQKRQAKVDCDKKKASSKRTKTVGWPAKLTNYNVPLWSVAWLWKVTFL